MNTIWGPMFHRSRIVRQSFKGADHSHQNQSAESNPTIYCIGIGSMKPKEAKWFLGSAQYVNCAAANPGADAGMYDASEQYKLSTISILIIWTLPLRSMRDKAVPHAVWVVWLRGWTTNSEIMRFWNISKVISMSQNYYFDVLSLLEAPKHVLQM